MFEVSENRYSVEDQLSITLLVSENIRKIMYIIFSPFNVYEALVDHGSTDFTCHMVTFPRGLLN